MDQIQAVVIDPSTPGRLVHRAVPAPSPAPAETLVRVAAASLNLGEVRQSLTTAEAGWRPGWDLAGTVDTAAGRWIRPARRDTSGRPRLFGGVGGTGGRPHRLLGGVA